jgi:hypothetical protein
MDAREDTRDSAEEGRLDIAHIGRKLLDVVLEETDRTTGDQDGSLSDRFLQSKKNNTHAEKKEQQVSNDPKQWFILLFFGLPSVFFWQRTKMCASGKYER